MSELGPRGLSEAGDDQRCALAVASLNACLRGIDEARRALSGLERSVEKLFLHQFGFLPGSQATKRLRKKRRSQMSRTWTADAKRQARKQILEDRLQVVRFQLMTAEDRRRAARQEAEDWNSALRSMRARFLPEREVDA